MKAALIALAAFVPAAAQAADAASQHVSFVTCPIYRDAARQCWLAERGDQVLYIGRIGLASPPALLHQVLIEGTLTADRSCGGQVVQPVHVSVLPELDYDCNTVLPDNGDKPSEPGIFDAPDAMLMRIGVSQPTPTGPFTDKGFSVRYSFGRLVLDQGDQQMVERAARYAMASGAAVVEVHGEASQSRLDDGTLMTEPAALAQQRAEDVAAAMIAIGVDAKRVHATWDTAIAPGDGVTDPDRRAVEISVHIQPPSR